MLFRLGTILVRILTGISCLALLLVSDASPMATYPTREVTLPIYSGVVEETGQNGQGNWDDMRAQSTHHRFNSFAPPSSPSGHQRNEAIPSDVVPKDPNGFFHPGSLNRFKSSVASFKAWQRIKFFPDPQTLAHDKAQDAAAQLDTFIQEFSEAHNPQV